MTGQRETGKVGVGMVAHGGGMRAIHLHRLVGVMILDPLILIMTGQQHARQIPLYRSRTCLFQRMPLPCLGFPRLA